MRCEQARPLISAGLDEELEGTSGTRLRAHLVECTACSLERDTLAATVLLLRDLPEADPPASLRRRIAAALLDIEHSADGRRAGFAWLFPPRAPAWALGAALGASLAAIVIVVPWRPAHQHASTVARVPAPVVLTQVRAHAALGPTVPMETKQAVAPKKPPLHAFQRPEPNLTAKLPPQPPALIIPALPPTALSSPAIEAPIPKYQRSVRSSSPQRSRATHRMSPKPRSMAPSMPVAVSAPPDRRPQSSDDATLAANSVPPASTGATTTPSSDGGSSTDTNGMTLMSSMPPAPEQTGNDLVELRRRLEDRPLQIPELGQLKPASGTHASHDGWIRF